MPSSFFATTAEINSIIATNTWSCTLIHSDGTTENFDAFLAKWGRSSWNQPIADPVPAGTNKYVLLALPTSAIAESGERIDATKGSLVKTLQVIQCEVLDWKIEYTCEEIG